MFKVNDKIGGNLRAMAQKAAKSGGVSACHRSVTAIEYGKEQQFTHVEHKDLSHA